MEQFNQKVNKNYVKLTFTNEFEKYFSKYFKTLLKKVRFFDHDEIIPHVKDLFLQLFVVRIFYSYLIIPG